MGSYNRGYINKLAAYVRLTQGISNVELSRKLSKLVDRKPKTIEHVLELRPGSKNYDRLLTPNICGRVYPALFEVAGAPPSSKVKAAIAEYEQRRDKRVEIGKFKQLKNQVSEKYAHMGYTKSTIDRVISAEINRKTGINPYHYIYDDGQRTSVPKSVYNCMLKHKAALEKLPIKTQPEFRQEALSLARRLGIRPSGLVKAIAKDTGCGRFLIGRLLNSRTSLDVFSKAVYCLVEMKKKQNSLAYAEEMQKLAESAGKCKVLKHGGKNYEVKTVEGEKIFYDNGIAIPRETQYHIEEAIKKRKRKKQA